MNHLRTGLLCIYILSHIGVTCGQTTSLNFRHLSLRDAFEIAAKNNKDLIYSHIEKDISQEKEQLVFDRRLPELNFSSAYKRLTKLYQYENGLDHSPTTYTPTQNVYEFALDAAVPLYTGGRLQSEADKSKLETQLAEIKERKTLHSLRLDVATAFLKLCQLAQQNQLILDKMKQDSVLIHQVEVMKKNGASTTNELLRAKLMLSNHSLMLSDIQTDMLIAGHLLKTILSLPDSVQLQVNPQSLSEYTASNASASTDSGQNDEMMLALKNKEILQTERSLIRSSILPQLNLVANYGMMNPNYKFYPPQPYFYRMGMVGLNLRYPISELYKSRAKFKEHDLALAAHQIEINRTQDKVNHMLYAANQKLIQADERIRISDEAIIQAAENYRTVRQKYIESLSLITELIDADNAYLEAQSNRIISQIDKELKLFQLLYLQGKI